MKQKYIFLESEGNMWLERNRESLGKTDHVSDAIEASGIMPKRVLEIGCSTGWRLAKLREKYGCDIMGIEPSMKAAVTAAELRVPVAQSTASSLPVAGPFDLIIYGHCLYLTDPDDWLTIVAEGDRVLAPGGHLIVHDFAFEAEPFQTAAFARQYKHCKGVLSYHFDFAMLWLIHPLYYQIRRMKIGDEMVTTLRKSPEPIEVLS